MSDWHVYLIRTRDGALYTGIATDVARRLDEHRNEPGKGARYLRGRAPLELVFSRRIGSRGDALKTEHRIREKGRAFKERIVRSKPNRNRLLKMLGLDSKPPAVAPSSSGNSSDA